MMKRIATFLIICCMFTAACGPKPQYKTRKGKKTIKKYNSVQYKRNAAHYKDFPQQDKGKLEEDCDCPDNKDHH